MLAYCVEHWPQLTMGGLFAVAAGYQLFSPESGKKEVVASAIVLGFEAFVLHCGGFW